MSFNPTSPEIVTSPSEELTARWTSFAEKTTLAYLTSFGWEGSEWFSFVKAFNKLEDLLQFVALLSLVDQLDDDLDIVFDEDDKGVPFIAFKSHEKLGSVNLKTEECASFLNFLFAEYEDTMVRGEKKISFTSNSLCYYSEEGLSGLQPSFDYSKDFHCVKGLPFDVKESAFDQFKLRFHSVRFEGAYIYNIAVV